MELLQERSAGQAGEVVTAARMQTIHRTGSKQVLREAEKSRLDANPFLLDLLAART